jgi:hypothetical protein
MFNIGNAKAPNVISRSSLEVDPAYEVELTVYNLTPAYFGIIPDMGKTGFLASLQSKTIQIKTFLPQNFSLAFGSNYETPLSKSMSSHLAESPGAQGDSAGAKKRQTAAKGLAIAENLGGAPNQAKAASAQVWKSGGPLSLSIPFVFAAATNTEKDVLSKFRILTKLAAPHEALGMLFSPGPSVLGVAANSISDTFGEGKNAFHITCKLGKFMYLDNVVVKNVDANIDFINDVNGKPMYMTFNVAIETFFTVTKQDIDDMLDHPSLGGNGVKTDSVESTPVLKTDRVRASQ